MGMRSSLNPLPILPSILAFCSSLEISGRYANENESLGNTNGGRFTTFGGGLPILNAKGELVGGIGASTGTPAQDQQVVQAGVDALDKVFKEEGDLKARL